MTTTHEGRVACQGGKFLNFLLGGEFYGVELSKVREIVGMMKVTPVAGSPAFVRGIVNLRGSVIPVIDLRRRFNMPAQDDTERTCIIVIRPDDERKGAAMVATGIVVDEVSEVIDIPSNQIDVAPDLGCAVETNIVKNIGKAANKVILLLDIDKVVSFSDKAAAAPAEDEEKSGDA